MEGVRTKNAMVATTTRVTVTVTTADGRGVVYRQRDRTKMLALLKESLRLHIQLSRKYDRMRKIYREALPVLSSQQKWETVLLDESRVGA